MADAFLRLCPDQWQSIGSIGTLLAVAAALSIAIFQDRLRLWFHRPKLEVTFKMKPPYGHKTLLVRKNVAVPCYYFRIKIKNIGKRRAKSVEVLAAELLKKDQNGSYSPYSRFLPMHLLWSHDRKLSHSISPNLFRYCDLGHIVDPEHRQKLPGEDFIISFEEIFIGHNLKKETIFCFDTEVRPFTSSHLIPFGEYRLVLLIGEEQTKTIRKEIDISFTGVWHVNEEEMLKKGVGIQIHK